jgi:hypothetical protein
LDKSIILTEHYSTSQEFKTIGEWISKQFLEEVGNHTVPLPTLRRSGSFADGDLSAENNPPSLIFLNHFQMKCFTAVEQKGA